MIQWKTLQSTAEVDALVERSTVVPCAIFKHSTRCNISYIAKHRLEQKWDFPDQQVEAYYLDLLAFRPVSNYIAERFAVPHESPQLLLICQGECVAESSHLEISVEELRDCLQHCAC